MHLPRLLLLLNALLVMPMLSPAPAHAAPDLAALWDFSNPQASEQRFRAALAAGATGDDALILHTQIARSLGLRRQFDAAREVLAGIEPAMAAAGAEARTRYRLELGRTWASASHEPAQLIPDAQARARAAFNEALATARAAALDGLAIDAIHMLAFVDTAPADQRHWNQAALDVVLASTQPAARHWEASVRNNLGLALHGLGRYDEALQQFQQALALREQGSDAGATRIARWMVAWMLRALTRIDEALALQLALEQDCDAAGAPDPYVFEELALLYRALGDEARARVYDARHKAARG